MGLTGDFAGLERLRHSLGRGQLEAAVLRGIKQQGLVLLKHEFATSTSATGAPFEKTVRGKPALVSKKLPQAFEATMAANSVKFVGRVSRDWLDVLETGHVFEERRVGEKQQYLSFNRRGRLVRESRLFNKAGELRRGVYQTFARAHTVKKRRLPPRPPLPGAESRDLPLPWDAAVKAGSAIGLGWWTEKVSR